LAAACASASFAPVSGNAVTFQWPSGGLQEVVVTAQRREESAQRAAVAVTAVSGEQLENAGVRNPTDLTYLVPALQVQPSANVYPLFFIRGIGYFTASPYTDSAVLFNYDGVPISRASSTSGTFYDLERIEVLKARRGSCTAVMPRAER
jgi:iron complex outermembrane receptor protein